MKILVLLFLLSISFPFAQEISFKGRISDSDSNQPIKNAVVFISNEHYAYSNSDGYFVINDLIKGKYNLKITQVGYKPLDETISLPNDSLINFSLQPSPIELDEIIVNTNRFDSYLRNSPYSELLINSKQLQEHAFQSLPEALKEEPGISLISEGTWGTEISIRGLSRENVVLLVDGNRIATSTDVAARFSLVDLNDIERVEVIKGGSSTLYGSGATGGIVNIITKSPSFNNNFLFNGNVSTGFNSVNGSSNLSSTVYLSDAVWAAKFTGSFRKAGNTQTPVGELKNSQYKDYGFSGNLNFKPFTNQLLKLNYQLYKANDVGIPGSSIFPGNAEVKYPEEKRDLISAEYEIQHISTVLYKLTLKYSNQYIFRDVENIPHIVQNVAATNTTPAKRVSVLKILPNADHINNNFQFYGNMMFAENNNLVLGIDYWDRRYNGNREKYQLIETLDSMGNTINTINKVIGEKPLPDSKFQSIGFFAQDDAGIIKNRLSLSLGARVDKVNVNGETTFNPNYEIVNGVRNDSPAGQKIIWNETEDHNYSFSSNIGLKYSLSEYLDFTTSIVYSFRSPSLEERFQYIDQGSYVRVGSPNLKPEKEKSIDLGVRYYLSNLKIISSYFFNYFNDLVAEIPGTFEGRNAFIKTNIGKSRLYGFDLNVDYNFYDDFIFYATASYVKGDDITSNGNLPEIPPLNGILGFRLNNVNHFNFDLSSTIFAAQNKVAEGELKTPGYAVFNLMVNTDEITLSSLNFKIYAGIENVLNKSYHNHLSTFRGNITEAPGRNFYVKLIAGW